MKKVLLYLLALFVFISCGKSGSGDSYLKIISTTPTSSQKDANIYDPITINFNEAIKEIKIVLLDTNKIDGQIEGTSKIIDKKVIFTQKNELDYSTYKVSIYKVGTISTSGKTLKENYSYTFTTYPQKVNKTPSPSEEKKENNTTKNNTNTNKQAYSACDLIPQMECSDIKEIEEN